MERRKFLAGALSLLATPALVRASSLEYVPRGLLLTPPTDFVHFDTFQVIITRQALVDNMHTKFCRNVEWKLVSHDPYREIFVFEKLIDTFSVPSKP